MYTSNSFDENFLVKTQPGSSPANIPVKTQQDSFLPTDILYTKGRYFKRKIFRRNVFPRQELPLWNRIIRQEDLIKRVFEIQSEEGSTQVIP
jgi:hypothetical protein